MLAMLQSVWGRRPCVYDFTTSHCGQDTSISAVLYSVLARPLLTLPLEGRGSSTHCVCLSVCLLPF